MYYIFFLYTTIVLFFIGLLGIVLNRTNLIVLLMSIEVALFSLSLSLILSSLWLDDLIGQLFTLLILVVAACETSVGLAIILVYFRVQGDIRIEGASWLKS